MCNMSIELAPIWGISNSKYRQQEWGGIAIFNETSSCTVYFKNGCLYAEDPEPPLKTTPKSTMLYNWYAPFYTKRIRQAIKAVFPDITPLCTKNQLGRAIKVVLLQYASDQ